MSAKKPKASATAHLRHLNMMMNELRIIEAACGGGDDTAAKGLDDFQKEKMLLVNLLKTIKDDIAVCKGLEEKFGNTPEAVRKKREIDMNLKEAFLIHGRLEGAVMADQRRYDDQREDALTQRDIEERRELCELLKQDLDYTQDQYKPQGARKGAGFQLAREARQKRAKQREQGTASHEPQPLTPAQQQFIQESMVRDAQLDEKLDVIHQGVKQLGAIAQDINEELEKQSYMLDEVEAKMDHLQDKLETRNREMKKILDASGGLQRWCPVIILFILFIALMGWIYNSSKK